MKTLKLHCKEKCLKILCLFLPKRTSQFSIIYVRDLVVDRSDKSSKINSLNKKLNDLSVFNISCVVKIFECVFVIFFMNLFRILKGHNLKSNLRNHSL